MSSTSVNLFFEFSKILKKFAESRTYERPFDAVTFRSFDDMVRFVGETLLLTPKNRNGDSAQSKGLCISRKDGACTKTLFKIERRGVPEFVSGPITGHGVKVRHAGETWQALPEKDYSEEVPDVNDETGTVLTILSQIYLLNQSSEFLEAPDNVLLQ